MIIQRKYLNLEILKLFIIRQLKNRLFFSTFLSTKEKHKKTNDKQQMVSFIKR